jgi:uncharacterized membrane protein YecN with MAPEG domain
MVFVLWFVVWFFAMSFVEHIAHRNFMHRKSFVDRWFPRVFESHAINHHHKYYKQFNFEPDEEARVENIHLEFLPSAPLALLLAGIATYFSWRSGLMLIAAVFVHHLIWNLIHQQMHDPKNPFFAKWGLYRFLARYHWMHHKHPGHNFNVVVPLADFVLGTYVRPSEKDKASMAEIGL